MFPVNLLDDFNTATERRSALSQTYAQQQERADGAIRERTALSSQIVELNERLSLVANDAKLKDESVREIRTLEDHWRYARKALLDAEARAVAEPPVSARRKTSLHSARRNLDRWRPWTLQRSHPIASNTIPDTNSLKRHAQRSDTRFKNGSVQAWTNPPSLTSSAWFRRTSRGGNRNPHHATDVVC